MTNNTERQTPTWQHVHLIQRWGVINGKASLLKETMTHTSSGYKRAVASARAGTSFGPSGRAFFVVYKADHFGYAPDLYWRELKEWEI